MTERILPTGIDTPELVVDRDRLYANVLGLQRTLDERGIRLRPHAKTHKSVRIGRLQVEAGAAGLTVGTLGEAEVFALAGLRDIFLAYPVWAEGPKAERVRALHGTADLRVGVDSAAGAERLGAAVKGMSQRLRVLVEIDPGLHRTGVGDPEAAVAVARAARTAGLDVEGVFAHAGHSYTPGPRRRGLARRDQHARGRGRGARGGRLRDRDDQRRLDADAAAVGDRPRQRDPCRDVRPRRPPAGRPRCDGAGRDGGGRCRHGRVFGARTSSSSTRGPRR